MKQRGLALGAAIMAVLTVVTPNLFPITAAAGERTPGVGQDEVLLIEEIRFTGNRRIPADSLRLWVQSREGDPYTIEQIRRDLRTILAQGYFEDAKVFTEDGRRGGVVVIFELKEYPVILDIDYPGMKSVSESDLLEEWRKRSIGLSKESQLDPVKATRAAAVIREMLAAKGRPEATVKWEPEEISKTAVILHFRVDEGPKVRVAEIDFEGNSVFDDETLRDQMQYVKKVGLITGFTHKDIYEKQRLTADLEKVRFFYADHGYIAAKYGEPTLSEGGEVGSGIPFFGGKSKGLKLTIPIEEGKVYRVGEVTVEGETVYPEEVIKAIIGLRTGDIVRSSQIQKGVFEDLKKLYGERGYIEFEPIFSPDLRDDPNNPNEGIADFHFELVEGKSFTVGRIEFKGNTYTRDTVLRREVLLTESDPYNQRYLDLSILKLNQLGYFEEIKDTDADIRTNQREAKVDVDLRVQEKGRQQIQFSGGISGVGGSFLGIQSSTNKFLGYGETFSFNLNAGNRSKSFTFSFTEPYLLGRPISAGFSIFFTNYQYYGGGITNAGGTFVPSSSGFGAFGGSSEELFTNRSAGGSVSLTAPMSYFFKRSVWSRFSRVGLSYSFRTNSIEDPEVNRDDDPSNDIRVTYQQEGVTQSTLTPTFVYNSLQGSTDPVGGQYLAAGLAMSGGFLGGDVNVIQPSVEYKFFKKFRLISKNDDKPDVFGLRVLAGHTLSFGTPIDTNSLSFIGGTPIYGRYFLGGEDTIRGYNVRSISPVARVEQFVSTRNVAAFNALNQQQLVVKPPAEGNRRTIAPGVLDRFLLENQKVSTDFYTPVGGDTALLFNFEYRIPIAGPVSMAAFFDAGSSFNLSDYDDQFTESEFIPALLTPFGLVIDPRGQFTTAEELAAATTPETPPGGLPPGFRSVLITGERKAITAYRLSEDASSIVSNYRFSLGAELRVEVPVINVPFRLIWAYNPNAHTDPDPQQVFLEKRTAFFFSIGRTF